MKKMFNVVSKRPIKLKCNRVAIVGRLHFPMERACPGCKRGCIDR